MSRPSQTRRSGDPRKWAAASAPADHGRPRRLLAMVALIAVAVLAFAVWSLREDAGVEPDARAVAHATAACDLTSKADEAAQVKSDARYAASVLVLDQAIIESARAAEADAVFAELDRALQAVHTAAHTGDPGLYDAAMETAQMACRRAPS